MRTCLFLTMDNPEGFVFDDVLAVEPLKALGWEVRSISWTASDVDWGMYEAVVPKTTWDYHHHLDRFLSVLESIERSGARLANGLPLIRWNAHKSYLLDLEKRGVPVVPTIIGTGLDRKKLTGLRTTLGSDHIVIKPTVGANADFTYPLSRKTPAPQLREVLKTYQSREYIAQRFVGSVISEGEFSLFYFSGSYSHTILKTPKENDFRVQEEHGGIIRRVDPSDTLLSAGQKTVAVLPTVPLYARADFVRDTDGRFLLMELELIEPALYFRMDAEAPHRFARAFDEWMRTAVGTG